MQVLADSALFEKDGAKNPGDLSRSQQDFELWKTWKDNNEDPNHFRPLLKQFKGLIHDKARPWVKGVDVPPAVVYAEFNKQFIHAARTYNPDMGSALGTWVTSNLRKAHRYLNNVQNPARIVETRSSAKKGMFDTAKSVLEDQYDREPTNQELSEHMGLPEAEIARFQAESRGALYSSSYSTDFDPTTHMPSREREVLSLVKPDLTPRERLVYEYLIGDGGKPELKPGEIAIKMGTSPSTITRIKQDIADKVKKYL